MGDLLTSLGVPGFLNVSLLVSASLLSVEAHSATVVIDFEALPDQTGQVCGPVCTTDPAQWIDKGFIIEGSDTVLNGSFPGGIVEGVGFAPMPADFGERSLVFCGTCGPIEITLRQQDGLTFDLLSFDQTASFPGGGDTWLVTGSLAGGGEVTTTFISSGDRTATFNSSWVNLESVTIAVAAERALDYRIDNIVVQVVPIPAAALLFASALGLLGLRCTRRAQQRSIH